VGLVSLHAEGVHALQKGLVSFMVDHG
jgi:hypothetical protein